MTTAGAVVMTSFLWGKEVLKVVDSLVVIL
jgi:hypothetical protein